MLKTEPGYGLRRTRKDQRKTRRQGDPTCRNASLVICAFVMVALAFTYRSTVLAKEGRSLSAIESNIETARAENQHLQLEVATLTSPRRIESIAIERLGMISPEKIRSVEVQSVAWVPNEGSTESPEETFTGRLREVFGKIGSALAAVYGKNVR